MTCHTILGIPTRDSLEMIRYGGTNAPDVHPGFIYKKRRYNIMAKSNKSLVPEAKEALNQFKMEAASEVGVPVTTNCLQGKL